MSFILSGFATREAYDTRELTWDGQEEFADELSAQAAAETWLVSQGPDAQVEIIRLSGNEGVVVAVVSQAGVERIE